MQRGQNAAAHIRNRRKQNADDEDSDDDMFMEEDSTYANWYLDTRPKAEDFNTCCPARIYILWGDFLYHRIINSNWFDNFIMTAIIVASLQIGIQTVDPLPQWLMDLMGSLDTAILAIFTVECFLKFMSESIRPWLYFCGPNWKWNVFDFTIVLLCT